LTGVSALRIRAAPLNALASGQESALASAKAGKMPALQTLLNGGGHSAAAHVRHGRQSGLS
jgi:hypothetical protein